MVCVGVIVLTLAASSIIPRGREARMAVRLPAWTSPRAVSSVFAVSGVPEPECTLRGGRLGGPGSCATPAVAFRDAGVDALLDEMGARGEPLAGFIGGDDVVVVAVDSRCADGGTGSGRGRLAASTDVVKGLVWRILQRPGGFSGEVVVAGESPGTPAGFATTPANAADRDQSLEDVVTAFSTLGYQVSLVDWRRVAARRLPGGPAVGAGFARGEYADGDLDDAMIVLDAECPGGALELTYPKVRTAGGRLVSLRHGVWGGERYHPDRLRLVSVAVLTADGALGARGAWANLAGIAVAGPPEPTALGCWLSLVRRPDLNVVDATWVGDDSCTGAAVRRDTLLAGTDPFALDWYASELVLYPAVSFWQDASAARAGVFREATRSAQRAAAGSWTDGAYPWLVIEEGGGDTPSRAEREQLDAYVVGASGSIFEDGFDSEGSGLWSDVVR